MLFQWFSFNLAPFHFCIIFNYLVKPVDPAKNKVQKKQQCGLNSWFYIKLLLKILTRNIKLPFFTYQVHMDHIFWLFAFCSYSLLNLPMGKFYEQSPHSPEKKKVK